MENNGFERFSKAWKKSGPAGSAEKFYAEEDIKVFRMKKSKDFSQALNRSLAFDFIQKSILIAAMLLLVWFYRTDMILLIAITGIIGLSVYLLFKEGSIKREYQKIDEYSRELSTTIKEKVSFFRTHLSSLQWMLAFTNTLLVWVGSLFYFYSKYGRYRIDDVVDIVVNLIMLTLAFAISFAAYRYQYHFNLNMLEENLADLDDEAIAALHIQTQKRRKKRLTIGLVILGIAGLLLLAFLVISFLIQGGQ